MADQHAARSHRRARALATRVRDLREARGWTRAELAANAGVTAKTVTRLESGGPVQPSFFTVGAVAEALGVTLDTLFRETALPPGLWSVGYEGRDIDSFVSALLEARIDVVADVRLTPISRKKGFSKTRLGQALAHADIGYTHLRGLGNPKDNRAPFWDGRVTVGRARFRGLLRSPEAQSDLDRLVAHAQRSRVAVLCFERDESRCHRQVVLETVRERAAVPVVPLS